MPWSCSKCQCGCVTFAQRHVVCFMGFLAILLNIAMRGCLHILINEMVMHHATDGKKSECPEKSTTIEIKPGTVPWSTLEQATVLAGFFYGYIVTHLPGGYLSDIYGPKHMLGATVLLTAVLTLISPVIIDHAPYEVFCVIRFVIGLAQGPMFPSVSTLMAKWVPIGERARVASIVYSSAMIGNVLCFFLTAVVTAISKDWRVVFYFWTALGLLYLFFHRKFFFSTPDENPHVLDEEREMLRREIGASRPVLTVPWLKILTDSSTLAIIVGWTGHVVPYFFYCVNFPRYLRDVLRYNIVEVGSLMALPQLVAFVFTLVLGVVADSIINRGWMSRLLCRRLFGVLGILSTVICCQLAAYIRCERTFAVVIFNLGMIGCGFCYASVRVNALDVTRNFAGIVMALINGIGALGFWPIPHLLAVMTPDSSTDEWIGFYWVMTGFAILTSIFYLAFCKVEIAEWDKIE